MPNPAPPADLFWLLTGEVPSGPFSVDQIHAKIVSGGATWQTLVCPVGGSTWLPLLKTPGIGPSTGVPAGESAGSGGSVVEPQAPQANTAKAEAANANGAFWVLVGSDATGPFRVGVIRAMLRDGQLAPDGKVRRVGTDVWVSVGDVVRPVPPRTPRVVPAATAAEDGPLVAGPSDAKAAPAPTALHPPTSPTPADTPCTPVSTVASNPDADPPALPRDAPKPAPLLDHTTRQWLQVGIGVLLMAGFLGVAKGCKEDAMNQPTLQDRLKEHRNKNSLPSVPPPKTKSPSEQ